MKAFSILGGAVSPCAVVVARTAKQAKLIYNNWLELTYGRRDEGVGISELEEGQVCVHHGGLFCYSPGVRGAADPRFHCVEVK